MKVFALTKDMSREEWLALRRQGIGGSDAPGIMGVSSYSSVFDVWMSKVYEDVESEDNEAMYWGRVLEEVLAKEFTKRTGKKLRKRHAILRHDVYPYMLANVDRLVVGEDAGWEGKTTNAFYKDNGSVPEVYWVQCQHYMAVTKKPNWYLSVFAGGQRYYDYLVARDDDYIKNKLIPAETAFWNMVLTEEMPAVDGSEACTQLLHEMFPEANAEELVLPDKAVEMIREHDELTEIVKHNSMRLSELSNEIKYMLGDHSIGLAGDRKIYWTNVTTKRFDGKLFEKENPDLYGQYTKESSYRRFQIK